MTLEFGMWAGGAAAPIPAGGAGAGGGSNKTHMRRKQREAERPAFFPPRRSPRSYNPRILVYNPELYTVCMYP